MSTSNSIGFTRGSWTVSITAAKTLKIVAPGSVSSPARIFRIASRWRASARSSSTGWASPLPSWIGPGQANMPPQTRPSRRTSPKWPRSIRIATAARQLPWVGSALNWQGQPQSQLQLASSGPRISQSTYAMLASLCMSTWSAACVQKI